MRRARRGRQVLGTPRQVRVVGQDGAAAARRDNLVAVKTQRRDEADVARVAAVVGRTERLGGVLNEDEMPARCDLDKRVEIAGGPYTCMKRRALARRGPVTRRRYLRDFAQWASSWRRRCDRGRFRSTKCCTALAYDTAFAVAMNVRSDHYLVSRSTPASSRPTVARRSVRGATACALP